MLLHLAQLRPHPPRSFHPWLPGGEENRFTILMEISISFWFSLPSAASINTATTSNWFGAVNIIVRRIWNEHRLIPHGWSFSVQGFIQYKGQNGFKSFSMTPVHVEGACVQAAPVLHNINYNGNHGPGYDSHIIQRWRKQDGCESWERMNQTMPKYQPNKSTNTSPWETSAGHRKGCNGNT